MVDTVLSRQEEAELLNHKYYYLVHKQGEIDVLSKEEEDKVIMRG